MSIGSKAIEAMPAEFVGCSTAEEIDALDTVSGATTIALIALKETIKTSRALSPSLFKAGSKRPTLIHFLMKRRMFGSPLDGPTARARPLCPGKQSGSAGSWPIAIHPAPPFLTVVLSNVSSPGRSLRHGGAS